MTQLRKLKIDRVYSGGEVSLAISDQIAAVLTPEFANPIATSSWRSDKYEMQEAARKAGINAVKQLKVGHLLTPEEEKQLALWDFHVILKPINSSASIGVFICHSVHEVKHILATQKVIDLFGQPLNEFVVQEYLQGTEYFVDGFSFRGKHWISGVQEYQKKLFNDNLIYLYAEVVPFTENQANICVDYVKQL